VKADDKRREKLMGMVMSPLKLNFGMTRPLCNMQLNTPWGMQKKKDEGKKFELVRLPYRFKFQKTFSGPCAEWLKVIETMCNEIFGNYTKKEDQLITASFGT
jgi:hypothetical protein